MELLLLLFVVGIQHKTIYFMLLHQVVGKGSCNFCQDCLHSCFLSTFTNLQTSLKGQHYVLSSHLKPFYSTIQKLCRLQLLETKTKTIAMLYISNMT